MRLHQSLIVFCRLHGYMASPELHYSYRAKSFPLTPTTHSHALASTVFNRALSATLCTVVSGGRVSSSFDTGSSEA